MSVSRQLPDGTWGPAIPVPYLLLGMKICHCGRKFWTQRKYRAHYFWRHLKEQL